jgi:hypothetical protein
MGHMQLLAADADVDEYKSDKLNAAKVCVFVHTGIHTVHVTRVVRNRVNVLLGAVTLFV